MFIPYMRVLCVSCACREFVWSAQVAIRSIGRPYTSPRRFHYSSNERERRRATPLPVVACDEQEVGLGSGDIGLDRTAGGVAALKARGEMAPDGGSALEGREGRRRGGASDVVGHMGSETPFGLVGGGVESLTLR